MSSKQTLLILEEDPTCQRMLRDTLKELANPIIATPSSLGTLDLAPGMKPDLIILGIHAFGFIGYELCEKFRLNSDLRTSKIILSSTQWSPEERQKSYEAGADDYWIKPLLQEEILAKGRLLLNDAQAQKNTAPLLKAQAHLTYTAQMKALGEMAGGIAHEINTPLNTLLLSSEQIESLIQEGPIPLEALKQLTQTMNRNISRVSGIIQALQTFCKDSTYEPLTLIPAQQLIQKTLDLCSERLKAKDIKIQVEIPNPQLKLQCQATQITQLLLHLITNARDAVQFMKDKWIHIEVTQKDHFIEISVTDSGSPIPKEIHYKLFHPFFTTKEIGQGSGLGLIISKGIAEMHNGELKIDREFKNTRFVLKIPMNQKNCPLERV